MSDLDREIKAIILLSTTIQVFVGARLYPRLAAQNLLNQK
jgi:hypothetical protein